MCDSGASRCYLAPTGHRRPSERGSWGVRITYSA